MPAKAARVGYKGEPTILIALCFGRMSGGDVLRNHFKRLAVRVVGPAAKSLSHRHTPRNTHIHTTAHFCHADDAHREYIVELRQLLCV